ncbi:MAG TPA: hypothetical protein VFG66_09650 [Gemmatimonadales bacterium]|nr:hypothetical protein [Gemmatimonadales bacterium]
MPAPHLSEEEVAGFLDAVVDSVQRRRVEAHLVRCDVCLNEVIAALTQLQRRGPAAGE